MSCSSRRCPQGPSLSGLVWILIVIPMYAVGAWLTWRLPTHPQPVRLLVCGTAIWRRGARVGHGQPAKNDQLPVDSGAQHAKSRGGKRWEHWPWRFSSAAILTAPSNAGGSGWLCAALAHLLGPPLALLASPVVPVSLLSPRTLRSPQPVRGELARLAGAAGRRAGSEKLVGLCHRRAGYVCTFCRRRCSGPGSDAIPVRCRRRGLNALYRRCYSDLSRRPEDWAFVVIAHPRVAIGDLIPGRSSTGFCATGSSIWISSSASPSRTALHRCSSRPPMQ